MPMIQQTLFSFQSDALDSDAFTVVSFEGEEEISRPFCFEINLISEDAQIDLEAVLNEPAFLEMKRNGEPRKIHGLLADFEQSRQVNIGGTVYTQYRAVLVPRLWLLSLSRQNQIYQNMSVQQIIEEELKGAGLTTDEFEFRLTGQYPEREYVVQYQETDLNFISRLMEHEGIFYFFEHNDERDKLIIADSDVAFVPIAGESKIVYRTPSGMATSQESVQALICRQQRIPKQVILKDYNYRTPSIDLRAEATVDDNSHGLVSEYGDHFKDPDQGTALAKIRAEEIRCRQKLFLGEGDCMGFQVGFKYTFKDHYRSDFNLEYLITKVSHSGMVRHSDSQNSAGVSGLEAEDREANSYRNEFTTIPADVVFRPERITPKPKLYGIMNAKVDAAGDGQYAEIDDQGRYKVILPFDLSGKGDGKASRFIRMAQPHAGANYGMHFPLHKDIEVLLAFVDGDLDRPIIANAVPNPATSSPVTSGNQTQSVIRTAGDNEIIIEDTDGGQQIRIRQACNNEILMDAGGPNIEVKQACGNEIFMKAEGPDIEIKQACGNEILMKAGGPDIEVKQACGNEILMHESDGIQIRDKYGNEVVLDAVAGTIRLHSPSHNSSITLGKSLWFFTNSDERKETFGNKKTRVVGEMDEEFVGSKFSKNLSDTYTLTVGSAIDVFGGIKVSNTTGASYTLNLARECSKNLFSRERKTKGHIKYDSEKYVHLIGGLGDDSQLMLQEHFATISSGDNEEVTLNKGESIQIFSGKKIELKAKEIVIDADKITLKSKSFKVTAKDIDTPWLTEKG